MFARTLIYKEYLILISLHDSLFYSLTFQIHIHIHIFISEVTCYFCNFCYRLTILLPLKFFFTFLPFYPFTFKLRPDVAPTAWRRNLFCVPTLPSLHRHAFSSPSPRIFIPPRIAFSSSWLHFSILHFCYFFRFLVVDC